MTERKDAYWDDLGIAWTAIEPGGERLGARMRWRLRRQGAVMAAVVFTGLPVSLAGVSLGIWTIWLGASTGAWNFVTRGAAILAISLMAGFAAWSFRGALRDNTRTPEAMIELALQRAERWLRAVQLGYASCILAAVLGMVGYEIRVHRGVPPAISPAEPLALLALLAAVLFLLHGRISDHIAKYRYLKNALLEGP